ncbi:MAG TPA: hypothetical protein VMW62_09810 [Chloroflexota bacterium]|nr:hypothetical protein [Chloroflexota bacterium]
MRYDWSENGLKFTKKRAAGQPEIVLVGPGGDPDVKRMENYLERMNLDYAEIDTREEPLPEGFKATDQPIVLVDGDPYLKAKPQEVAQVIGLAMRHYHFDGEAEASA